MQIGLKIRDPILVAAATIQLGPRVSEPRRAPVGSIEARQR
jgi:hypothetical protein